MITHGSPLFPAGATGMPFPCAASDVDKSARTVCRQSTAREMHPRGDGDARILLPVIALVIIFFTTATLFQDRNHRPMGWAIILSSCWAREAKTDASVRSLTRCSWLPAIVPS
ncbi:hypothetical protein SEVIR_6G049950v4 [Setaria viridis]